MSSAWMRPESVDSFFMVRSLKAIDSRYAHASSSKTASRPASSIAETVQRTSKTQQGTEGKKIGESSPGLPARSLMKTVVNACKTTGTDDSGQHHRQYHPQATSNARCAVDHVCPEWAYTAIWECPSEEMTNTARASSSNRRTTDWTFPLSIIAELVYEETEKMKHSFLFLYVSISTLKADRRRQRRKITEIFFF